MNNQDAYVICRIFSIVFCICSLTVLGYTAVQLYNKNPNANYLMLIGLTFIFIIISACLENLGIKILHEIDEDED